MLMGLELSKGGDHGRDVDPTNYKSLVWSLRYLKITRSDIVHGVRIGSRLLKCRENLIGLLGK